MDIAKTIDIARTLEPSPGSIITDGSVTTLRRANSKVVRQPALFDSPQQPKAGRAVRPSRAGAPDKTIRARLRAPTAATLLLALASTPASAAQCSYQVDEEWATGFQATIFVTNRGARTVHGWEVEIELPAGSDMMRNWNSQVIGNALYAASNADHNRTIEPFSTVSFAFTASNPRPGKPLDVLRLGGICEGNDRPQWHFDARSTSVRIAQPSQEPPPEQLPRTDIPRNSTPRDSAPTAFAVASVVRGAAPLTVEFDASASGDAHGNPVAHHWTFAEGDSSKQAVVSRTYRQPGTYVVELVVDDGAATSEPALLTITVESPPPAVAPGSPELDSRAVESYADATRDGEATPVLQSSSYPYTSAY